jgi:hypothetical protein
MSAALPTIDRKDLLHGSVIEEEVDNLDIPCYPLSIEDYKEL